MRAYSYGCVLCVTCLYLGLCVCAPMCSPVFCMVCAGPIRHSPASPCSHSKASGKLCSLLVAPNFHLSSWSGSRPRVAVAASSVWGEATVGFSLRHDWPRVYFSRRPCCHVGGPVEAGAVHTEEQCGGCSGHGNGGCRATLCPPALSSDLELNEPWKGVVAACSRGNLSSLTWLGIMEPVPLQWKRAILTAGGPGKSGVQFFSNSPHKRHCAGEWWCH